MNLLAGSRAIPREGGIQGKKGYHVGWPPLIYTEESFKAAFYNFSFQLAGKKLLPVILSLEKLILRDRNILLFLF